MVNTTPLSTAAVAYPNAWPGRVHDAPNGLRRWWLGRPGNLIELPAPNNIYAAPRSMGENAQTSLGGVTTTMRRRHATSAWQLQYPRVSGRDRAIIEGFYRRAFGAGPWCFLPPGDINRLPYFTALCGTGNGALEGWAATGGTAAYDLTLPQIVVPCGVIRWSGAANGNVLAPGLLSAGAIVPDTNSAAPYVPAEPVTVQVRASVASGTRQVTLAAQGMSATGPVAAASRTVTLSTVPQTIIVTAVAGALGASLYVLATVTAADNGAADILITTPQLEYASAASDWTFGTGVPRVVWPQRSSDADQFDARHKAAVTMSLTQ